jgi:hypothetical protein
MGPLDLLNSLPIFDRIATVQVTIALVSLTSFIVGYAFFYRWTKNSPGIAVFILSISFALLLALNALVRWFGPIYPGREVITISVYTILDLACIFMALVLVRRWGKGEQFTVEPRHETMPTLTIGRNWDRKTPASWPDEADE